MTYGIHGYGRADWRSWACRQGFQNVCQCHGVRVFVGRWPLAQRIAWIFFMHAAYLMREDCVLDLFNMQVSFLQNHQLSSITTN